MTREESIIRIKRLYGNGYVEQEQALDMAISDMKRVEELETANKRLTDILAEQSKNLDSKNLYIEELEAESKRLKDCLQEIKDICLISPSVIFPSDILDTINKYLESEKSDKGMKEIIDLLKKYTEGKQNTDKVEVSVTQLNRVIKALEQQPILDKIRAEIENTLYVDSLIFGDLFDFNDGKISADDVIEKFNRVTRLEVLQIIDKYRAESEG